ncbi:MucBP domain-containing protein [Enterococcus sp. DIV0756]|uniref:MucBP domain-containing protein n=1 Tax=Enterococcus sp. DIV0756 TaxID=2774636 RepID=UPI003F241042
MRKRMSVVLVILLLTNTLISGGYGFAEEINSSVNNQTESRENEKTPQEKNEQEVIEKAKVEKNEGTVQSSEELEKSNTSEDSSNAKQNSVKESHNPSIEEIPATKSMLKNNLDAISFRTEYDTSMSGSQYLNNSTTDFVSGETLNLKTILQYTQLEEQQETYVEPRIEYTFPADKFKGINLKNFPNEGSANIKAIEQIVDPVSLARIIRVTLNRLSPGQDMVIPFTVTTNEIGYRDDGQIEVPFKLLTSEGEELRKDTYLATARTMTVYKTDLERQSDSISYSYTEVENGKSNASAKNYNFVFLRSFINDEIDPVDSTHYGVENKSVIVKIELPGENHTFEDPSSIFFESSEINGNVGEWVIAPRNISGASVPKGFVFPSKLKIPGVANGQTVPVKYSISYIEDDGSRVLLDENTVELKISLGNKPQKDRLFFVNSSAGFYSEKEKKTTGSNVTLSEATENLMFYADATGRFSYTESGENTITVDTITIDFSNEDFDNLSTGLQGFHLLTEMPNLSQEELEQLSNNKLIGIDESGNETIVAENIPTTTNKDDYILKKDLGKYKTYKLVFNDSIKMRDTKSSELTLGLLFGLDKENINDIRSQLTEPGKNESFFPFVATFDVQDPPEFTLLSREYSGPSFRLLKEPYFSNFGGYLDRNEAFIGSNVNYTHSVTFITDLGTGEEQVPQKIDGIIGHVLLTPKGIELERTNIRYLSQSYILPTKVIENYRGTGKNAYFFLHEDAQLINQSLTANYSLNLNFDANVGENEIESYFIWGDQDKYIDKSNDKYVGIPDSLDINDNGNKEELVYHGKQTINIRRAEALTNFVKVKNKSESQAPFLSTSVVVPENEVTYRLFIQNSTKTDYPFTESLNVLPYVGDHVLTDETEARNSEFPVTLSGPVRGPEGYEVLYSLDEQQATYKEDFESEWIPAEQVSDFSSVKKIKITSLDGTVLKGESEVYFEYDAKIADAETIKFGEFANNSFGTRTNKTMDVIESGNSQATVINPFVGGKVFLDKDENGIYSEAKDETIDNYKVILRKYNEDSEKYEKTDETTTDNVGEYFFGELPFGKYQIEFELGPNDQITQYRNYAYPIIGNNLKDKNTIEFEVNDITYKHYLNAGVFRSNQVTLKVIPTDEKGDPIDGYPTEDYPGIPGESVEIKIPEIPGYERVTPDEDIPTEYPEEDTDFPVEYVKITPITVTYKDEDGNELREPEKSTQRVNTEYNTEGPETIEHDGKTYELIEIPSNAQGTVGYEEIKVDYVYKKVKDKTTITVTPTDEKGDPIDGYPTENYPGIPGESVEITVPEIPGYERVTPDEDIPTEYPEEDTDFPVEYVKITPITVTYKDEDGKKLREPEKSTQRVNTEYNTEGPKTIEHDGKTYELIEVPSNAQGTVGYEEIKVDYVYKKVKDKTTITVTPTDEKGDPIDGYPSENYPGIPGESVEITVPEIPGYERVTPDEDIPTEYPEEDTDFPVEYVKITPITVTYKDEDGNELHEPEKSTQRVNTEYNTEGPETIEHDGKTYELIEVPSNAQGTVGYEEIKVDYVYKKVKDKTTITVTPTDEKGDPIDGYPTENYPGIPGESVEITVPEIPGYERVTPDEDIPTEYPEEDTDFPVEYVKITPITVTYKDEDGNELREPEKSTQRVNTEYSTEGPKTIEHDGKTYELIEVPSNAQGTVGYEAIIVAYVYKEVKKVNELPKEPSDENDNQKKDSPIKTVDSNDTLKLQDKAQRNDGQSIQTKAARSNTSETGNAKVFPKMNDRKNSLFIIIGTLLVVFSLGLEQYLNKRRRAE